MTTSHPEYDLIIIGAGPAGLSFARTLSDTRLRIALIERQPEAVLADPPEDGRDIALTHTSEKMLRELGLWDRIPDTEIGTIRDAKVVDGGSPYALSFDSRTAGASYLGRIVPNHLIRKAAYEAVQGCENITLLSDATVTHVETDDRQGRVTLQDGTVLSAPLIIAADSRMSENRRRMGISASMLDFGRVVIVCEMTHDLPHDDTAFECFQYDQTLAILPMNGLKSSVVITLPSDRADAVLAMPNDAFAADVEARFGGGLGSMKLVTKRHPYPLMGVLARQFVANRFALLGDAAVGMHPVTAHGFNLGLSGAGVLSREIRTALRTGADIGDMALLKRYEAAHRRVVLPLYHGTNALVRLFTNTSVPGRLLRSVALRIGNVLPPVKHQIMRQLTEIHK